MQLRRKLFSVVVVGLVLVPAWSFAVDSNARVVELRSDCTGVSNCFTTTSELTTWLWAGGPGNRANPPSATDRVVVLAGPGSFGRFDCDGSAATTGYVSVIGAGREFTRFVSNDGSNDFYPAYCNGGINALNCKELNFQDLTAYGSHTGVYWIGGGSSNWSDVDVVAGGPEAVASCGLTTSASLAWYDIDGAGGAAKHYFFGSRIISRGVAATGVFDWVAAVDSGSTGSEIWFYGGDILVEPTISAAFQQATAVRLVRSTFEAFGTSIRTKVGAATSASFGGGFEAVDTVSPSQQAKFHIHGGIVVSDASASATNVNAVAIRGSGHVHALDTAFVVKPGGTGTATRLAGNASMDAPFLWPSGSTPPSVSTIHGNDLFVDTAAGPSNNEAHLMVYDTQCTGGGGPWRDMADNACRQ